MKFFSYDSPFGQLFRVILLVTDLLYQNNVGDIFRES